MSRFKSSSVHISWHFISHEYPVKIAFVCFCCSCCCCARKSERRKGSACNAYELWCMNSNVPGKISKECNNSRVSIVVNLKIVDPRTLERKKYDCDCDWMRASLCWRIKNKSNIHLALAFRASLQLLSMYSYSFSMFGMVSINSALDIAIVIDWLTGKFQFGVQITRLVKETQCENYMHIEIGQSVIGLSIEYFSCCRICARQKQSERKKKRAKSINMKILLSSAKVMCVWFHACEWNEGERGSDK